MDGVDALYEEITSMKEPDGNRHPATLRLGMVHANAPAEIEVAGTDQELDRFWRPDGFQFRELRAGDRLLLLTDDDQIFFVLGKVVAP